MKSTAFFIVAALALLPATLRADEDHKKAESKSAPAATLTTGEIKKVDKETGKVTIKHGPIENLGMPGMTMIFRVKEPAMLDQIKAGDKINFAADRVNGAITVLRIEAAQ